MAELALILRGDGGNLVSPESAAVVDPKIAIGDEENRLGVDGFFIDGEMAEVRDLGRRIVFIDPVFIEVPMGGPRVLQL